MSNRPRIARLAAEGLSASEIAVQRYYDDGHSVRDCVEHFGCSRQTWHAATKRGAVIARPQRIPLERLCAAATP